MAAAKPTQGDRGHESREVMRAGHAGSCWLPGRLAFLLSDMGLSWSDSFHVSWNFLFCIFVSCQFTLISSRSWVSYQPLYLCAARRLVWGSQSLLLGSECGGERGAPTSLEMTQSHNYLVSSYP